MANPKIPKGYQGTYAKNSDGGDTLVMVSREVKMTGSKKGEKSMAKNTTTNKPAGNTGSGKPFEPTFRKYLDMTEGEQAAFRQGAKTTENKVKERLGLTKPRS